MCGHVTSDLSSHRVATLSRKYSSFFSVHTKVRDAFKHASNLDEGKQRSLPPRHHHPHANESGSFSASGKDLVSSAAQGAASFSRRLQRPLIWTNYCTLNSRGRFQPGRWFGGLCLWVRHVNTPTLLTTNGHEHAHTITLNWISWECIRILAEKWVRVCTRAAMSSTRHKAGCKHMILLTWDDEEDR